MQAFPAYGYDEKICLWNLKDGRLVNELQLNLPLKDFRFEDDSGTLHITSR